MVECVKYSILRQIAGITTFMTSAVISILLLTLFFVYGTNYFVLLIFAAAGILFIVCGVLLTVFSMQCDGEDCNNMRNYLRERVRLQENDPQADNPHDPSTSNAPSNAHGPDDNVSHQNFVMIEFEGSDDDGAENKNKSDEAQSLPKHYSHDISLGIPESEGQPDEPSRRPTKNTQRPITSELEIYAEVHTSKLTSQNILTLSDREGMPSTSRQEIELKEITTEVRSNTPRETHQESSAVTAENRPPSMMFASHNMAINSDVTQEKSHHESSAETPTNHPPIMSSASKYSAMISDVTQEESPQESSTEIPASHPPSTLSASQGLASSSDVKPEPSSGEIVEESTTGVSEITRNSNVPPESLEFAEKTTAVGEPKADKDIVSVWI